jgi:hypothetical protein
LGRIHSKTTTRTRGKLREIYALVRDLPDADEDGERFNTRRTREKQRLADLLKNNDGFRQRVREQLAEDERFSAAMQAAENPEDDDTFLDVLIAFLKEYGLQFLTLLLSLMKSSGTR